MKYNLPVPVCQGFFPEPFDILRRAVYPTGMKGILKYSIYLPVLFLAAAVLFGDISIEKKAVTAEQLQGYKTLLPWKPEDIVAFPKNAECKDGSLKFDSYVVLDTPPKEKDAKKAAKELEKFKAKYVKKGTAPFKVMVSMELIQKKDNKTVRYLKGKSDIYILNEKNKKLALNKKVDNDKLCPS